MNPLRLGVIGLGHLGSLHVKMLSTAQSASLVAVYDIDEEICRKTAARYSVHAASSLEEVFAMVDAVSIATPTSTHFDVACKAIARSKHLFIEKPITQTVEQARELNARAAEKSVLVQVGHIERFNPAIVALDSYALAPVFIESHRLAQFNPRGTDVAVVLDLMIHDIDIILSLVNSDVTSIDASGVAVVTDSADIANARIRFANGCVANITASRISQKRMRKMRLFQRNAYISIDFLDGSCEVFRLVEDADEQVSPTIMLGQIEQGKSNRSIVYEQPSVPKDLNPLQYELQLFIEYIHAGKKPIVDGVAGQRALEVAEQIVSMIEPA